jgi:type IV pilus assembly protein PilV
VEVTIQEWMMPRRQKGVSLVEVLVTLVIVAVGLLGLVGLQTRLQVAQVEAYQRAHAVLLVNDMSSRLAINRNLAADYVTVNPIGAAACTAPGANPSRAEIDQFEWCEALRGAYERIGTNRVGTLVGGRGCVEELSAGEYMITVAWQGLATGGQPPASVTCGANAFDGPTGTPCANDACRRALTTIVRVADLTS